jgi:hypothetical protein
MLPPDRLTPELNGDRRPLRLGLLLQSVLQPSWFADAIRRTLESAEVELSVLLLESSLTAKTEQRTRNRGTLWKLYERRDRTRSFAFADPLVPVDISQVIASSGASRTATESPVPSPLLVSARENGPSSVSLGEPITDDTRARIRALDLDVLVAPAVISDLDLDDVARFGLWTFQHSVLSQLANEEMCVAELAGNVSTCTSHLVAVRGDGSSEILAAAHTMVDPFSLTRSRRAALWHSAPLLARAVAELSERGSVSRIAPEVARQDVEPGARRYGPVPDLVSLAARLSSRRSAARRTMEQWGLAFRLAADDSRSGVPDLELAKFHDLTPPIDRMWADPFPIRREGRHYVYIEEMLYESKRGHISVFTIDENGTASETAPVLMEPHHLSYPFLLERGNDLFMIPESSEAGLSLVYRATRFPDQWQLEQEFFPGMSLVDATLAEIDGRWWLFTGILDDRMEAWGELYLFHSASPFGPWKAHRRNPVVSDVRHARPAGRLYESGGRWFRPAQDCSKSYGYALSIQEIVKLSESEYEEREVARRLPDWTTGLVGTHTLNACPGLTMIDVRRRVALRRGA